jgi:hypothetical protein
MCERYSWIEKDGEAIFLTAYDVFDTKRGRELQKYTTCPSDWYGHGAIREYYGLVGGSERECEDFTTPTNFPPELVAAIKAGRMWGFGITEPMLSMLTDAARELQAKAIAPAFEIYRQAVEITYIVGQFTLAVAGEHDPGHHKYLAAHRECFLSGLAAHDAYAQVRDRSFAELFADPKNRIEAWR